MKRSRKPFLEVTRTGGFTGWTVKLKVFSDGRATVKVNRNKPVERKISESDVTILTEMFENKLRKLKRRYLAPGNGCHRYAITYNPPAMKPRKVTVHDCVTSLPPSLMLMVVRIENLIHD